MTTDPTIASIIEDLRETAACAEDNFVVDAVERIVRNLQSVETRLRAAATFTDHGEAETSRRIHDCMGS